MRKVTSLTLLLSGIVLLITSIILYIEPHGRVAFWADWTLLGLTKNQWDNLHINTGFLFSIALLLHIYLNWKPIIAYLKDRASKLIILNKAFIISLFVTTYAVVGTLAGLPPMEQIIKLNEFIKELQTKKYGNPPFGHAELASLEGLCRFTRINAKAALTALRNQGYEIKSPTQSLKEIARANGTTPQKIFEVMLTARRPTGMSQSLPDLPPAGTGKMTLKELCKTFGLSLDDTLKRLKGKNIAAEANITIKEIARRNGITPLEVYYALKPNKPATEDQSKSLENH